MRELLWENTFAHTSHVCSFSARGGLFGRVRGTLELHSGLMAFSVRGRGWGVISVSSGLSHIAAEQLAWMQC